ncbi:MAG: hypothetical protein U1D30_23605 [Planctomycetota bacterium]
MAHPLENLERHPTSVRLNPLHPWPFIDVRLDDPEVIDVAVPLVLGVRHALENLSSIRAPD